jgi:hypothetical protein
MNTYSIFPGIAAPPFADLWCGWEDRPRFLDDVLGHGEHFLRLEEDGRRF